MSELPPKLPLSMSFICIGCGGTGPARPCCDETNACPYFRGDAGLRLITTEAECQHRENEARLEGARIVRDAWRADLAQLRSRFRPELAHELHDDDAATAMGGADAAIESAQAHIPDDAQLQKLIEGEG